MAGWGWFGQQLEEGNSSLFQLKATNALRSLGWIESDTKKPCSSRCWARQANSKQAKAEFEAKAQTGLLSKVALGFPRETLSPQGISEN